MTKGSCRRASEGSMTQPLSAC